ncbi:hypothetical protein KY495_02455 [Massilia sp. PAMC28688]|uniref:tetratricopeptide repeat protein n=1 Tax=Massilia sp. PAMC28688 TaxID=2861283 RepID=UPI001C6260CE|nr:hypothetical protein [Massilia sp. PAMC28688]QYF94119.1 hypothetical protein KY495_02455 [Massilia sp. PAMC28688]
MSQFRLVRLSLIAAALGLSAAPALLTSAHAQAQPAAAAAAPAAQETIRPDMFKLIDPAKVKEMMAAKNYAAVQANLTAARAFPNITPYEMYVINRMELSLGATTGNDKMAMAALEAVINSGRLNATEKATFIEALANYHYNAKDYKKAIEWMKTYQKESPTPEKVTPALARAYYITDDFANAKVEAERMIAEAEKAGRKPSQEDYRLLASVAAKLKDNAGYIAATEKLVASYPSADFWTDLIRRLHNQKNLNERLRLDVYRLQMATAKEMEDVEYIEMAERAAAAGFFAEAKQVLDAGFAAGKLGNGADAAKHKAALAKATKNAADDAKTIANGEAGAMKAKSGTPLFNLGLAYVGMDQADKGIEMMEQGIAKGGMKNADDSKLRLAAAYAKAGRKDDALKTLREVKGTDGAADIARYWILHLNAPAAGTAAPAAAGAAPAATAPAAAPAPAAPAK